MHIILSQFKSQQLFPVLSLKLMSVQPYQILYVDSNGRNPRRGSKDLLNLFCLFFRGQAPTTVYFLVPLPALTHFVSARKQSKKKKKKKLNLAPQQQFYTWLGHIKTHALRSHALITSARLHKRVACTGEESQKMLCENEQMRSFDVGTVF